MAAKHPGGVTATRARRSPSPAFHQSCTTPGGTVDRLARPQLAAAVAEPVAEDAVEHLEALLLPGMAMRRPRTAAPGVASSSPDRRAPRVCSTIRGVLAADRVARAPCRRGPRRARLGREASCADMPRRYRSEQLGERAGVEQVGGRRAAAARGADGELHVGEALGAVRVGRADDPHAGRDRVADVLALEVEPVREAVDLERHAVLDGRPRRRARGRPRSRAGGRSAGPSDG